MLGQYTTVGAAIGDTVVDECSCQKFLGRVERDLNDRVVSKTQIMFTERTNSFLYRGRIPYQITAAVGDSVKRAVKRIKNQNLQCDQ
jgi:hypothetical protein